MNSQGNPSIATRSSRRGRRRRSRRDVVAGQGQVPRLACGAAFLRQLVHQPGGGGRRAAAEGGAGPLGHATIQMTADVYGHLFPRSDDRAELAAGELALVG